jgi:hypothetical protein
MKTQTDHKTQVVQKIQSDYADAIARHNPPGNAPKLPAPPVPPVDKNKPSSVK